MLVIQIILKRGLNLHNNGLGAKFTRGRTMEVIIYSEKYLTKR